jgi:hypothetical protein
LRLVVSRARDKVTFDFIILKSGKFASLKQTYENEIRNKNKERWHPQPTQKAMKTEDDAKASQNTLTKQLFKRRNLGRRRNTHTCCALMLLKLSEVPVDGAIQKKMKGKGCSHSSTR